MRFRRLATPREWSAVGATAYGENTGAQMANLCLLRYRQNGNEGYRRLVLAAADRYLESEPDIGFPVYPGTLGDTILLMLGAHELSGAGQYLARAAHFARQACAMFLDEQSPLPRASSRHDHYEGITRAITLMMALLKLWQVKEQPRATVSLTWSDR